MTANQIKYQEMLTNRDRQQEDARHNLAGERETVRHNVVSEREVNRHNIVTEGISRDTLSEQRRHNIVGETISRDTLNEQARHNKVTEFYDKYKTAANVAQANAATKNARINEYNANTTRFNAVVNMGDKLVNAATNIAGIPARYISAVGSILPG